MYDILFKNGHIVTPDGTIQADIGVTGGKITAIGKPDAPAAEEIDCKGLHILPGVIDTQVHFREPGNTHKEDLNTGTLAALAGGVTAVFEMPNTDPLTTTAEALQDKLDRAAGRAWCNYAFFVGGTGENAAELPVLERLPGCCGVKVFMGSSTGNLLTEDDETLERILSHGTRRVAVHAEDEARLKERAALVAGSGDVKLHPHWRDVETALKATQRLLRLAHKTGRPIHVLHVTTAEEMELLAANKDIATVEVTPQHLTLFAPDCYERLGTLAQMNPPIREERHRAALWKGLQKGVADLIGSDHAPHTHEEKARPYPESPSGMPGVQTLVPLMLNHVNHGRLTLERFVDMVCHNPQRIYGIKGKGRIETGYDGDLTIVDMNARRTISNDWVKSKCGWTPFDGMEVTGWPVMTVLGGVIAMRDDEISGTPSGQAIAFTEE
ncbi:MAG: dihydroorotase [Pseudomonadota bacterium]|nr:dihydroorotase [Pseudomonadota bacterium]QKK05013.1 MAG: dihydroorotase [Pseudomonadota bacterium]